MVPRTAAKDVPLRLGMRGDVGGGGRGDIVMRIHTTTTALYGGRGEWGMWEGEGEMLL